MRGWYITGLVLLAGISIVEGQTIDGRIKNLNRVQQERQVDLRLKQWRDVQRYVQMAMRCEGFDLEGSNAAEYTLYDDGTCTKKRFTNKFDGFY